MVYRVPLDISRHSLDPTGVPAATFWGGGVKAQDAAAGSRPLCPLRREQRDNAAHHVRIDRYILRSFICLLI